MSQGGRGFGEGKFYHFSYPEELSEEHHISRLEAINLVVSVKTLIKQSVSHVRLHVLTDNMATAQVLMSGRTKDPVLAACAREVAMFVALRGMLLDIEHTPGVTLVLADALSRRGYSRAMRHLSDNLVREKKLRRVAAVGLSKLIDVQI